MAMLLLGVTTEAKVQIKKLTLLPLGIANGKGIAKAFVKIVKRDCIYCRGRPAGNMVMVSAISD